MKLPYNESYCFCLENIDDVKLFDEYVLPNLAVYSWNPLGFIIDMDISLPRFVHIVRRIGSDRLGWYDGPDLPDGKFLTPIDALFNAEKYPELLI